jgi:hypothetical protein
MNNVDHMTHSMPTKNPKIQTPKMKMNPNQKQKQKQELTKQKTHRPPE